MSNKFKVTLYTLQQLSDKEKMQRLWKILDIPIISPKFYDAVELAKIPFDSNAVETAAELYESKGFLFVRGEKDSFLGVFSKQSKGLSTWNIWLNIKAMQGNKKERWLEWLFHLCSEFPVLYGQGCSVAEYDAKHADIKVLPNGGRISGTVGVSVAEFYQYLPGLYWLNIFGAELVKAFGESTLMTLPDVEARSLNSHQIAICLLESVLPESMEQRLQSERRLADILGAQFFFDRNRTDLKFKLVPHLNEALEYSSSNGASRTEETIGQESPSKIELEEDFENQVVLAFDSTAWTGLGDLAEQLVIFLHSDVEDVFSFSRSALKALDAFFIEHPQRMEYNKEHLCKDFIPALGAYLGEVLVQELGGEWIMREPLLKSTVRVNGKEISTFWLANQVVYEGKKLLDVYSIVS